MLSSNSKTMNTIKNQNANTAPVHTARAGNVRASVWESSSDSGQPKYKIIISRLFKQGEKWEWGHTFYGDQLAPIIEAAGKAQPWIQYRQRELQFPPTQEQP
jgi:hypothetical protein